MLLIVIFCLFLSLFGVPIHYKTPKLLEKRCFFDICSIELSMVAMGDWAYHIVRYL